MNSTVLIADHMREQEEARCSSLGQSYASLCGFSNTRREEGHGPFCPPRVAAHPPSVTVHGRAVMADVPLRSIHTLPVIPHAPSIGIHLPSVTADAPSVSPHARRVTANGPPVSADAPPVGAYAPSVGSEKRLFSLPKPFSPLPHQF